MARVSLLLCGICLLVFIVQTILPGFSELFLLDSSAFVQPWRFVTAMFLHGDIAHLFYNLLALFFFGLVLESTIGFRKFLLVFFVTGILANVLSVFVYDSSLGASGAIFGIIGCLIMLRPSMMVFAFGLPMPLFIAGIAWGIGDLVGLFVPASGIANLAHLSGMFFGLVFGLMYRGRFTNRTKTVRYTLPEEHARRWEDVYLR